MRIFTAIEFDNKTKEQISNTATRLKEDGVEGRFLGVDTYHLTLNFIGETERVQDVKKILDRLSSFKPFTITFSEIGRFKRKPGDILWLGIEDNKALSKIQHTLMRELALSDFDVETGKYTPHITLARKCRIPKPLIMNGFADALRPIEYEVKTVSLMKSTLTNKGALYDEIYSVKAKP